MDGCWIPPPHLHSWLVPIWDDISSIGLPSKYGIDDKMVWLSASNGDLSLSLAYDFKRNKQPVVQWDRWVWQSCFRPRNSVTLWKYLHGKMLTDDLLQQRGFTIASVCSLCCEGMKTASHIFFECSFARQIGSSVLDLFRVQYLFQDIFSFFHYPLQQGFGMLATLFVFMRRLFPSIML